MTQISRPHVAFLSYGCPLILDYYPSGRCGNNVSPHSSYIQIFCSIRVNYLVFNFCEFELCTPSKKSLKYKLFQKNPIPSLIRTPFLIISLNFFFTMFSGPFVVVFYSVEIYKNSGVEVNEHVAAIISAAVRVGGQLKSSLNRLFLNQIR